MQGKIDMILEEMTRVYKNDKRPWIIGYSGGKDSTVVVQLVYIMLQNLELWERHKKVYVVSSDTLVENPMILEHLEKTCREISESAKKDKIPIETHIVHPEYDDTFWTNIIGRGFPTPKSANFRWCTERMKIDPSNKFIEAKVDENGEVVVLLGVRKDESIARKESIEKREIDGYLLNPHQTLRNTYVYSPIVELTTDEVWDILLSNNGINPWNGDNDILFTLYADGDGGECPFILVTNEDKEIKTPSCGTTRFGCWTCTVVNEDRSLKGFIESGEEWLIPLVEYRQWLLDIRDNRNYRDKKQRNGRIYRLKRYVRNISRSDYDQYISEGYKVMTDDKGDEFFWIDGLGPFNFKGRKLILKRLLETENEIGIELIKEEELREIEKIWNKEFDLRRNELSKIYKEVKGEELSWAKYNKPLLSESVISEIENITEEYEVEEELYKRLLILTDDNKVYVNKRNFRDEMDKLLNQQWLHRDIYDEEYIDEN